MAEGKRITNSMLFGYIHIYRCKMNKGSNKEIKDYFQEVISDIKNFAIFRLDQNGVIITWNYGCELMKGYKPEEAIGQHYEILFPDFLKEKNAPQEELEETFKSGRYESENWRKKKNGQLFWAHVLLTKVVDDNGKFAGYIKITQDFTDRKNFETQLKKEKENLQKANAELAKTREELIATHAELIIQKNGEIMRINQDLDGFIYTASHDLRSPISNMEGLLNAMSEYNCYYDKDLNPLFHMLEDSVEKLKKTINHLTEISKIQKVKEDDIEEVSVSNLIDEVTFRLSEKIKKTNTIIKTDIENCPVIKFSVNNLRIIIYNLLSNSINYASPDRVSEVFIKTEKVPEYYVLVIKDNGLGIAKEHQAKIFSWFKRFHDHVEGTGLGLYMVKRIIDNTGGKIEVESELGKGTTFKIFLKNGK